MRRAVSAARFDRSLEHSRLGRAEAQSSHAHFDLAPEGSRVAQMEELVTSTHFDLSLETSRAVRVDAVRSLSEQQELLNRLFPKDINDMKGSARALLVSSTKAIKALLSSTETLEMEALGMRRSLAREHVAALDEAQSAADSTVSEMRDCHEANLAALRADLSVAEVVDKREMERVREALNETVQRERAAKARVAEKVAAQAAGHSVTVRELEEALDTHRTELHYQLDLVRGQLRDAEVARRQSEADKQAAERAHQREIDQIRHEKASLAAALREQTTRTETYSRMVDELREAHSAVVVQAAALQDRVEQTEEYTNTTQAIMVEKMANMHRMQSWALASSSAKALEMRGVRELAIEQRSAHRALNFNGSEPVALSHRALSYTGSEPALGHRPLSYTGSEPALAHRPLSYTGSEPVALAHRTLSYTGSEPVAIPRAQSASRLRELPTYTPRSARSRSPTALPSARHAARSRGLLYSEMTRARFEALGGSER